MSIKHYAQGLACIFAVSLFLAGRAFAERQVVEKEGATEVVCTDVAPPSPDPKIEENAKAAEDATLFKTCKDAILPLLKSPASAIFNLRDPKEPSSYTYGDKQVRLVVDAQNGYGALIRDYYRCQFDSYLRLKYMDKDVAP